MNSGEGGVSSVSQSYSVKVCVKFGALIALVKPIWECFDLSSLVYCGLPCLCAHLSNCIVQFHLKLMVVISRTTISVFIYKGNYLPVTELFNIVRFRKLSL